MELGKIKEAQEFRTIQTTGGLFHLKVFIILLPCSKITINTFPASDKADRILLFKRCLS